MKPRRTGLPSRSGWLGLAVVVAATSPTAAALAARSAAPRADAVFTGVTAQGMAVRLGPQRRVGRTFKYQARLRCSDDSNFTDDPFTDIVRLHGRRFSLSRSTDADAVHVRLTGVAGDRTAHGTIRITERYSEVPDAHGDTPLNADGGILCDSGIVQWNAKLAGG
jgi:hypothetical protein